MNWGNKVTRQTLSDLIMNALNANPDEKKALAAELKRNNPPFGFEDIDSYINHYFLRFLEKNLQDSDDPDKCSIKYTGSWLHRIEELAKYKNATQAFNQFFEITDFADKLLGMDTNHHFMKDLRKRGILFFDPIFNYKLFNVKKYRETLRVSSPVVNSSSNNAAAAAAPTTTDTSAVSPLQYTFVGRVYHPELQKTVDWGGKTIFFNKFQANPTQENLDSYREEEKDLLLQAITANPS